MDDGGDFRVSRAGFKFDLIRSLDESLSFVLRMRAESCYFQFCELSQHAIHDGSPRDHITPWRQITVSPPPGMIPSLKRCLRTTLSSAGIEVRMASNLSGVDPLKDLKRLHNGSSLKTVIDIGANVGQSALRFHEAFPGSSIHSFEPVVTSFESGRSNTARYPAIEWHHLAVGNTTERIVFFSSGTSQMNSITNTQVPSTGHHGERNEVEVVRFDDFFTTRQLNHVDLLKTDTEGLDLAVLQGAEAALSGRHISFVLCEVGFVEADGGHSFFPPIAAYLEKFGYRLVGFYGMSNVRHFQQWGVTYADALFAMPHPDA